MKRFSSRQIFSLPNFIIVFFAFLISLVIYNEWRFQTEVEVKLQVRTSNHVDFKPLKHELPIKIQSTDKKQIYLIQNISPLKRQEYVKLDIRFRDFSFVPFYLRVVGAEEQSQELINVKNFGALQSYDSEIQHFSKVYRSTGENLQIELQGKLKALDIQLIEISLHRLKHNRLEHQNNEYAHAFLIISAVGLFIYWKLFSAKTSRQWLLVVSGVCFLVYLNFYFAASVLTCTLITYFLGRCKTEKKSLDMALFFLSISTHLCLLFSFKYFFSEIASAFSIIGAPILLLPLGLSYFVFRLVHSTLCWQRGAERDISLREYFTYIFFMPTIPAGPIETLSGFKHAYTDQLSKNDILFSLRRFFSALVKKFVIADGVLAPMLFKPEVGYYQQIVIEGEPITAGLSITFLLTSFLYVYMDFSAYSDIAVGLSRLFGYRIMENFNWPLLSRNLKVFWQNWHISLSAWCRREIYFPVLASSRNNFLALYCAMMTIGFWHNLDINWLCWSIHHGTGLWFLARWHKSTYNFYQGQHQIIKSLWTGFGVIFTFFFVTLGFAFVMIYDWSLSLEVYSSLLGL